MLGLTKSKDKKQLQELSGRFDELVDRLPFLESEDLRSEGAHRFGGHQAALARVGREPFGELAEQIASSLGHEVPL